MAKRFIKQVIRCKSHVEAFLRGKGELFENASPKSAVLRVVQFCGHVYQGFLQNRAPVRAAALAYTTVLALVPMLAIAISISTSLLRKERDTTIPLLIEQFVASVAPMLAAGNGPDASGADASGASIEIVDMASLVGKLTNRTDPVSSFIWQKLSATNQQALARLEATKQDSTTLRTALAGELNRIIQSEWLYDTNRFAGVKLSEEALRLAARRLEGEGRTRLNVLLFEESYPRELLRSRVNRQEVVGKLQDYVNNVVDYIDEVKSGTLGVTAVMMLVFIAISLLSTIEATFNDIWAVPRGRTWMGRIMAYWAGLTLGPLLLLTALGLTSAGQFEVVREWLQKVEIIGMLVFRFIIPGCILSIAFSALYLLLPNIKVDWRAAMVGGTVAGCLLQLNSLCSVVYGSRAVTYSKIYGSLAVVPLFLVGLYLSWTIILLGAQVAYVVQFRNDRYAEKLAANVHQRGRELAALQLMTCVGQKFMEGNPPPTSDSLAIDLELPTSLVQSVLGTLVKCRVLHRVSGNPEGFSPGRPLDKISAREILQAVRSGEGQDLPDSHTPVHSIAKAELASIETAEAARSGVVSVADLVQAARGEPV
ncbi:MAG: YihY family inner membrane protein [Verrucomicrobia bacterium]|nr:YihY family inner membrane protein [Verrucomicrobiota bacterium]